MPEAAAAWSVCGQTMHEPWQQQAQLMGLTVRNCAAGFMLLMPAKP
jgi:hypothetical protein